MREPRVTKVLEKSVEHQRSDHCNTERLRSRRKQLHLETHLVEIITAARVWSMY